jgi:hypothetical protein
LPGKTASDLTRGRKKKDDQGGGDAHGQPEGAGTTENQGAECSEEQPDPRYKGAQPFHPAHFRPSLSKDEATVIDTYGIEDGLCPICHGKLKRCPDMDKQYDHLKLRPILVDKILNEVLGCWCSNCQKFHYGAYPTEIATRSIIRNTLTAILVQSRATLSLSISSLCSLFSDILDTKASRGFVCETLKRELWKFMPAYLEAKDFIKSCPVLCIDETSSKRKGKQNWIWVFCAEKLTLFTIGTRSTYMLDTVLGPDYTGTFASDRYKPYFCYLKSNQNASHQICTSHLDRDCEHCIEHLDSETQAYGWRLKKLVQALLHWHNEYQRKANSPGGSTKEELINYFAEMAKFQAEMTKAATENVPKAKSKAQGIAKVFNEHGTLYFTFVHTPGVDPSNNRAQRSIRPIVIFRHISLHTQSEIGNMLAVVLPTISSTLKLQKRKTLDFIVETINAAEEGTDLPSLIADGQNVDKKYAGMAAAMKEDFEKRQKDEKARKVKERAQEKAKRAQEKSKKAEEESDKAKNSKISTPLKTHRKM